MIANNSIRSAISLTHLAVALCCFGIFFFFFSTEANFSFNSFYRKKEFLSIFILLCIGFLSLYGFVSWQTIDSKTSKLITYGISLFFLIELIAVFSIANVKSQDFILIFIPTITPAIYFFLLGFSKIAESKIKVSTYNDSLDSDFLDNQEEVYLPFFWKPNRILSFTSFVFSILSFVFLLAAVAPIWSIAIPCSLLVISLLLWIFPKIGSWISAIISILTGIGIVLFFIFAMIEKPLDITTNKDLKFALFISTIILSIFLLCISLAMFLLSKEAKKEWKK